MSNTLKIYFILIIYVAKAEVNDLDIQYIVDTVEQAKAEALAYKLPENAYQYKATNTTRTGNTENRCRIPRGKGLGGTSLLNAMMYVRGNKYDYDLWAQAGNKGWSYGEVLPYFIKSENSQINGNLGYHGKGGLLNVDYYRSNYSVTYNAFLESIQELGGRIVDYNGEHQLGASNIQLNTLNSYRHHTGKAFLERAEKRRNLKVLTYSYATKVIIDKSKTAKGVLFTYQGQTLYAKAKNEVILSAGAISSPQLLMLSGIGPSNLLKSLSIPIVADLPVGENYQDHATFWGLFVTTNVSVTTPSTYEDAREFLGNFGLLTAVAVPGVSFLRTKLSKTHKSVPNIEILIRTSNTVADYTQRSYNYDDETYNGFFKKVNVSNALNFFIILLKPESRGTVKLKSSNPFEYPLVDPSFLSDKDNQDIEVLYEAINFVKTMLETDSFKKVNAKLFDVVLPQCQDLPYDSKEQWFCQIRHLTSQIYHPIGTCKMAPNRFKGGVVNSDLKVHGIKKLRVVDASIIPDSTAGHTSSPAIMIAEKIADTLKRNFYRFD